MLSYRSALGFTLYINFVLLLEVQLSWQLKSDFAAWAQKKNPFYRIVVADSRYPRDGRFIEEIGTYDPLKTPADVKIDADKAKQWIANGAQPTDTVKDILKKSGVID